MQHKDGELLVFPPFLPYNAEHDNHRDLMTRLRKSGFPLASHRLGARPQRGTPTDARRLGNASPCLSPPATRREGLLFSP
ncbi:MAG: hypothetical protein L0I62_06545, partial [Gammaproteobacteria bacterium]|nr:hypothetical protein [Gammaproteobacteria bacterium]